MGAVAGLSPAWNRICLHTASCQKGLLFSGTLVAH